MERIVIAAGLALLLALTGCASSGNRPGGPLATYEKTGGFAGFNTRLVVQHDGTMTLEDRKTGRTTQATADPASMERLRALAASPDLRSIQSAYPPPPGGADLLTYDISVSSDRGSRSVRTTDAAEHPQIVTDLIGVLDDLWGQARATAPRQP